MNVLSHLLSERSLHMVIYSTLGVYNAVRVCMRIFQMNMNPKTVPIDPERYFCRLLSSTIQVGEKDDYFIIFIIQLVLQCEVFGQFQVNKLSFDKSH